MTTISFTVYGQPVGKGRARSTRTGIHYTPAKTQQAEESFLAQALPYKPDAPLRGPLRIEITAIYSVPSSWSKKRRVAAEDGIERPTVKPDMDNVVKLILDSLNGVFYLDDKQVVELEVYKFYGPMPCTNVTLLTLLTR